MEVVVVVIVCGGGRTGRQAMDDVVTAAASCPGACPGASSSLRVVSCVHARLRSARNPPVGEAAGRERGAGRRRSPPRGGPATPARKRSGCIECAFRPLDDEAAAALPPRGPHSSPLGVGVTGLDLHCYENRPSPICLSSLKLSEKGGQSPRRQGAKNPYGDSTIVRDLNDCALTYGNS